MIESFIAKKHIKERKKQTLVSIIGISLGITVLLVSLAIGNGLNKEMIDNILSITAHISVTNSERTMYNYNDKKNLIEQLKGVEGAIPKYNTQGIMKYTGIFGTFGAGVKIESFDSEDAKRVLELDKKIVEGSLNFEKVSSILIGKELADQIAADVGETVTLTTMEREKDLIIAGIFQSGYYDYDTTMVFIPMKTAHFLAETDDVASEIDVKIKNIYKADEIAKEIAAATGLITKTWGEQNRNLLKALSLEKTVMLLVLSLIVVISGFVVGVLLSTLVVEKTRDIGVLRAIGYSRKNIMKIFIMEGMIIGGQGIALGAVLSLILINILEKFSLKILSEIYYLDKIPVDISIKEFLIVIIATFIIVFIASVLPAYRASKLKPVEALNYD